MAEVLGRITASGQAPRGPDVKHRVRVEREWLSEGAAIEFQLPRNLTCATCDGGGCDACDRSGAVSVRGRADPAESIQVTLPACGPNSGERGVVLRIPEQGGFSVTHPELPRGLLLLSVMGSDTADPGVSMIPSTMPPPQVVGTPSLRPTVAARSHWFVLVALVVLALLAAVLLLRR